MLTAVVPGVIGIVVAYAVQTSGSSALRRVVSTASGVFANFGGVPLGVPVHRNASAAPAWW